MYDQSKLSELIRFARVDAGSTVIDVYPGDGDWTRLFSDIVRPEGRVYSFVPAAHLRRLSDVSNRRLADVADPNPGRLSWAGSAPTRVPSGRTGVRAKAAVPMRASLPFCEHYDIDLKRACG